MMELPVAKSNLVKFSSDVEFIDEVLSESKELRLFLSNPVITKPVKLTVMKEIFKKRPSKNLIAFIEFIILKNREDILFEIFKRFLELRDEKLGILRGQVVTAVALHEKQKSSLIKRLQEYTGKEIVLGYKVDDKVVGGFLIRIGDTIIDTTISNQLNLLRKRFLEQN